MLLTTLKVDIGTKSNRNFWFSYGKGFNYGGWDDDGDSGTNKEEKELEEEEEVEDEEEEKEEK